MPRNSDKHQCEFIVQYNCSKPHRCRNWSVTQEKGKFLCRHHKSKPYEDLSTPVVGPLTIKGLITQKKNWVVNEALKFYEERTDDNLNDLINALTQLRNLHALQRNTDKLIPNCKEF